MRNAVTLLLVLVMLALVVTSCFIRDGYWHR
jgi:hypothetical protein